MSREIKMRAKRKLNGDWVYGSLIKGETEDWDYIVTKKNDDFNCLELYTCRVITNTLGEFIGLTDSKGNEIYEGDVLKYISDGILQYREVFWDRPLASFLTRNIHFPEDAILGFGWLTHNSSIIEVIGTIYDFSELLNKSIDK